MKNKFSINKTVTYIVMVLVAGIFSSCGINSKSSYTINPDFSAKCVFEEKAGLDMAMITSYYGYSTDKSKDLSGLSSIFDTNSAVPSSHEVLLAFASKILRNKYADAWKDIDLRMIGTDTVYFKGTAYFNDIRKGGMASLDTGISIYNNDNGQTVIEMKPIKRDSTPSYNSDDYKSLFKGGLYSSMMHYYMAVLLRDFYVSLTYEVPGKIISSSNFVKKNDRTAELTLNGKNMIHYIDTMMGNSDMLSRFYTNPTNVSSYQSIYQYQANKYMFGEAKPVRLLYLYDGKPLFDYSKEVAEAKKYYAEFRKKSGIDAYDSATVIKAEMSEAEKKKQEGTLILTAEDSANGKIYFKNLIATQYYRGSISFSGEISKPLNSSIVSVSITSLLTDKGNNILDSISNHDNVYAYLSNPSINYPNDTLGTPYSRNYKVYFSLSGTIPDNCIYLNIKGKLNVDSVTSIPFTIVNLNLIKTSLKDYGGIR